MELFHHIYTAHKLFKSYKYPISRQTIQAKTGLSRASFFRLIRFFKERLEAPLEYSSKYKGYFYNNTGTEKYELPGIWLDAEELHAVFCMESLIHELGPGMLDEVLGPLRNRLTSILNSQGIDPAHIRDRVRILPMASRTTKPEIFKSAAAAVLCKKQLSFSFRKPGHNVVETRLVCPQTLVHYKDNWYLDAWCHSRKALRTFALSRMKKCEVLPITSRRLSSKELDDYFSGAYGIFAGAPDKTAVIHITGPTAAYAREEKVHPKQETIFNPDGSLILKLPYRDSRELTRYILSLGEDAQVMEPPVLKSEILKKLKKSLKNYE